MTHIKQRGFTLIELVLVIIILGVVSVGLSGIIGNAMQAVITVNEREQLLREGSFLAERVNREINAAVPNSIRISGNASVHCMEFVPMLFSSLYLNIPLANESGTTADLLELSDIQGNPFVPLYSSGGSLMAQNVVNVLGPSASNGEQNPFKSLGASFQRNASTQLLFVFGLDDERITFMQEVQIPNVP